MSVLKLNEGKVTFFAAKGKITKEIQLELLIEKSKNPGTPLKQLLEKIGGGKAEKRDTEKNRRKRRRAFRRCEDGPTPCCFDSQRFAFHDGLYGFGGR